MSAECARNSELSNVVAVAQLLADDVLFPAALETDAAGAVPKELLDKLADGGLYGVTGPVSYGGLALDPKSVWEVAEALSSGCLTTAFVWAQHIGVVRAVAESQNPDVRELLSPLCRGELRSGLALGGALSGRPSLRAKPAGDNWTFDGTAPFVSGWSRVDVVHAAAATDDGNLVWGLVDARESKTLSVQRLNLAVLDATNTVQLELLDQPVSRERLTAVVPRKEAPGSALVLRMHASFALGVATRCCRLLGAASFDEELAQTREELDRLDPTTVEAARASAGNLAMRSAAALAVTTGSRSLLRQQHEQRLVREALFVLVYALRPGSRASTLEYLGAG